MTKENTALFSNALSALVNALLDEPGLRPSRQLNEALTQAEDALRGRSDSLRTAAYVLRHEATSAHADEQKGLIVAAELLEKWDEDGTPDVPE